MCYDVRFESSEIEGCVIGASSFDHFDMWYIEIQFHLETGSKKYSVRCK